MLGIGLGCDDRCGCSDCCCCCCCCCCSSAVCGPTASLRKLSSCFSLSLALQACEVPCFCLLLPLLLLLLVFSFSPALIFLAAVGGESSTVGPAGRCGCDGAVPA